MKNTGYQKKVSSDIFAAWGRYLLSGTIIGAVLCFCAVSVTFAAVMPKTLLIDDFSDYGTDPESELNNLKYWDGGGELDAEGNGGLVDDIDITDPGIAAPYPACHKLTYAEDDPGTPDIDEGLYQWWAASLWDGLHPDAKTNLLRYTHIAFEVKGEVGGEDFYVGLQETNKKKFDLQIKVSDFVQDAAIGTEWKTVRIPLNKFIEKPGNPPEQPGVNLNRVQAIDFMFYVPGSLSGTIYFTNVRVEGVRIDDFEDSLSGENLLRHEFSTGEGRMEVGCGDVDDIKIAGNRCHKLVWNIGNPLEPGFWYTNTYFESWNVAEPADISLYDTLNLRVRGEAGGETFKIEFQEAVYGGPINKVALSSSGYVDLTTNWQLLSIPLADFVTAGVTDKNNMTALTLLFGASGHASAGTIYIDDIYLAYDNQAPTIGGSGEKTFYVDHLVSFRIPGSDSENDHLIYLAEYLPEGAVLDANGLITWRPATAAGYGIRVNVYDGVNYAYPLHDPAQWKSIAMNVIEFPGFSKPPSAGRIKVDKITKKLLVDGKEFKIKSIGYHPVPIGVDPTVVPWQLTTDIADRDFPVLRELRVNTIRSWNNVNYTLLNYANSYGIKVCATFWVEANSDFTDPSVRSSIIEDFKAYVSQYKNYPAVLMWVLGNEVDFSNLDDPGNLKAWYTLANEMAKAAYDIEGANYHPVAISSAVLRNIGDVDKGADDGTLNYIDIWGMNTYTGYSFTYRHFIMEHVFANNYFADYVSVSDKPLWIAEYGIDSFVTTTFDSNGDPTGGYIDEATQSTWIVNNTKQILGLDYLQGSEACIGGSVMAYTDEWWKAGDENALDLGGYNTEGMGNDIHPDDYANEEYWGLFAVADEDILIKKQKDVSGTIYSAYDDLRDQCFNVAPVVVYPMDVSEVTFYKDKINGFYLIAADANNDTLLLSKDIVPLPSGYTYFDSYTGFFSWTPDSNDIGDHTVTFTAMEDPAHYEGIKSKDVTITIHVVDDPAADTEPPVAEAGGDITVPEDTPIEFDGSASTDNVGIMNYQWDYDYNGAQFYIRMDGPRPIKVYDTPGTYTVALRVSDGAGSVSNIDTLTVTITELLDRVNVPYGAATIQEGIDLANAGNEVYVWSGEYSEGVVMKNGVSLLGEDVYGCVIKGSILFKEVSGASVEKFTVEYPEGSSVNLQNGAYPDPGIDLLADAGVTLINSNAEVKSCVIRPDPVLFGTDTYGKGIQVWNLYGTGYIEPNIENNLIRNADTGIFLFSQAFGGEIWGAIQNNTLDNNNIGILERMHKENPLIQNNILTNIQDCVHITYADLASGLLDLRKDNIVTNNFYDSYSGGSLNKIWCDELGIPQDPIAGNIYVDPLYNGDYEATAPECDNMGWRLP